MKTYFDGFIRSGRAEAGICNRIIQNIQRSYIVLTEYVGDLSPIILGIVFPAKY